MNKDPQVYVEYILESITLIKKYIGSLSKEEFLSNDQAKDAVTKRLEVIGEAVKKLPNEIKDKHPGVPWNKIAGMRDVLVHDYFGVDFELAWKTAKEDLDQLEKVLR